ncbi:MAG: MYXO-CTERM domain-containing protein [Myxococcota bacterium]|jgi:MYXO-CTERM domain-containing protein
MLFALLLGVDGGCARDGTAVGNPGPTKPPSSMEDGLLRIIAQTPPAGITLSSAELAVTDLSLLACSGDDDLTEVSAILDLLTGEVFALTAGSWCGLQVALEADALVLVGATDSGIPFTATLDLEAISEDSTFTVDGQTVTLTLPTDFLDADAIESVSSKESAVIIESEDALAEQWTDALIAGTAPAGLQDSGEMALADADGGPDCGCATGGGGGWWLLIALVALVRRRSILPGDLVTE